MINQFTIPIRVPSSNDWTFSNRHKYTKHRNQWYKAMAGLLGERVTQAPDQMQAIIISERNRILDYQNLVAGCKPIPDALKHLGWIVDDDPSHWHCEYLQVRVPRAKEQTLLILIEEG